MDPPPSSALSLFILVYSSTSSRREIEFLYQYVGLPAGAVPVLVLQYSYCAGLVQYESYDTPQYSIVQYGTVLVAAVGASARRYR